MYGYIWHSLHKNQDPVEDFSSICLDSPTTLNGNCLARPVGGADSEGLLDLQLTRCVSLQADVNVSHGQNSV